MSEADNIDFTCQHCEQRLRVPASAAGKRILCPECNKEVTVPASTGITEEPAAPRSAPAARDDDFEDRPSHRDRDRDRDYDDFRYDSSVRKQASGIGGTILTIHAILLLIAFILGLGLDLFNVVFAIVGPEPVIDPQAPPFLQEIQRGSRGPVAAGTQGFFAMVAVIVIVGAIQMLRRKTWGLCLAACFLAMIHLGSCCCLLGLPSGIWALVLLVNPEVKETFS
jgi:hypothetical protein